MRLGRLADVREHGRLHEAGARAHYRDGDVQRDHRPCAVDEQPRHQKRHVDQDQCQPATDQILHETGPDASQRLSDEYDAS